jgi:uncharacterized protein YbjQ (UPF0145 family)
LFLNLIFLHIPIFGNQAYNFMLEEAFKKGANAVIGLKYESTEGGVLCYGTSVRVRKL